MVKKPGQPSQNSQSRKKFFKYLVLQRFWQFEETDPLCKDELQ